MEILQVSEISEYEISDGEDMIQSPIEAEVCYTPEVLPLLRALQRTHTVKFARKFTIIERIGVRRTLPVRAQVELFFPCVNVSIRQLLICVRVCAKLSGAAKSDVKEKEFKCMQELLRSRGPALILAVFQCLEERQGNEICWLFWYMSCR